jgi:hypothetical protein
MSVIHLIQDLNYVILIINFIFLNSIDHFIFIKLKKNNFHFFNDFNFFVKIYYASLKFKNYLYFFLTKLFFNLVSCFFYVIFSILIKYYDSLF